MNTAEILRNYEPLARKIAWQHRWCGLDQEDLVQTAKLGMVRCLDRFDPEKGALATHLRWGARAELTEYIRQAAFPVVAKTRDSRTVLPRVQKAVSDAEARGLDPTEARLAAAVELDTDIQAIDRAMGILAAPASDDSLAELPTDTTESWIEEGDRWTALMQALGSLDEQDQELILLRNLEGLTWQKIGERIGVSHRTATKRHDAAMKRIRARMKNLRFDDLF